MGGEIVGYSYARSRRCAQFHAPCDTVPVSLCLVSHTVGVLSYAYVLDAVIHTDDNLIVLACLDVWRDVILMGC